MFRHDNDVTQSAARRQFILANVLPGIKQKLVGNNTQHDKFILSCSKLGPNLGKLDRVAVMMTDPQPAYSANLCSQPILIHTLKVIVNLIGCYND